MDTFPISANSLEKHYHIDGNRFGQQYKEHLSDFKSWDQKDHAKDWILFPDNIGPFLSIDETALTNGELYTIITNKAGKGRKGTLVAMVEGTGSDKIIKVLNMIKEKARKKVKEVTLDMAGSMRKIVRKCFPEATRVIDRFHVQKLAFDALQEMRIAHRWDAITEETNAIENAKLDGKKHIPELLRNGDTKKQLLARSRYLLFKSGEKWTPKQKQRAAVLFELYPDIKKAYSLSHSLRMIFSHNKEKGIALTKMARWFNDVTDSGFKSFNTISATFYAHYSEILNYFDNRSTNASAESFNAKIKAFRSQFRGVRDITFFLFRLTKIYA
ncbi:transposase [Mariniphaga sediminis]|uniref:Transposase n=2 Tax=Mariniphaga sediminis TaxID=1628158 RepID=A0A399CTK4_9BACT|nr:transposase [Mariniphaga sediminis]RIH62696.1 transposase [Mariniphaga sediminis]